MRYFIDARNISHERLQDEVIIINLERGAYYSGSGNAADIWTLISQGATIDEVATLLSAAFSCEKSVVLRDVENCVRTMIERGIIQPDDGHAREAPALTLPHADRGEWTEPHFDECMDMWDLIQLDPIHDVGEAGWPFATPAPKV
jgi:coenzyme PQQ synthesis protein D (PqqD)